MKTKEKVIVEVFHSFKDQNVNFVVLRNFDDIPHNCTINNDIDVLVHKNDMPVVEQIFKDCEFQKEVDDDEYLYNSTPHQHFYLHSKDIHFDITNSLSYRSSNNIKQWIPVDERLQVDVFNKKIYVENSLWFYMPAVQDQFLHLICHCIFDKRSINKKYSARIELLFSQLKLDEDIESIKLCFFKFTDELIKIIKNGDTELLYDKYIKFTRY